MYTLMKLCEVNNMMKKVNKKCFSSQIVWGFSFHHFTANIKSLSFPHTVTVLHYFVANMWRE